MSSLRERCEEFFYGTGPLGLRGRYIMLGVDSVIIAYFLVTTFLDPYDWILAVDMVIGVILLTELAGRVLADSDRLGLLSKPLALLDIAIIISLFLPDVFGNFAFLRVVRALRVVRSYAVIRQFKSTVKTPSLTESRTATSRCWFCGTSFTGLALALYPVQDTQQSRKLPVSPATLSCKLPIL